LGIFVVTACEGVAGCELRDHQGRTTPLCTGPQDHGQRAWLRPSLQRWALPK